MTDWAREHEKAEMARSLAAKVDGQHYSALAPTIKALRKAKDDDAAAGLLLRAIDAIERETAIPVAGQIFVPRWYFDQLAIIYRKAGNPRASALLMQRYTVLSVQAETAGRLALERMRQQASAEAGVPPETRARSAQPKKAKPPSVTQAAARGLGGLLGSFVKALSKTGRK